MNYAVNPIILIPVLCVLAGLALTIFAFRKSRWTSRVLLASFGAILCLPAIYVVLGFHPELVDTRYRTYKAFCGDIPEGMTREEVLMLVDPHDSSTGPTQRPEITIRQRVWASL